ncbi:MAG: flagellin FliC [Sandaracinus sp.]|nr:flagellin FliC [Sandaracinus sp.]MCB9632487.1 flagellin FliC [Sandaracinus sp.]
MAMSIVTNTQSINAQRNLAKSGKALQSAMGQLSSGLRINRAGDDAAGLAISENLKAQTRSLGQAERNANDGISLLQTAEGGMAEVGDMLGRMRELAVQSSSDTVSDNERAFIQQEFTALVEEVDRIANTTEFNGTKLLDGSATGLEFQVGMRNDANDRISVDLADMTSATLGTGGGGAALSTAGLDSKANAQGAIDIIDDAIADVSGGRANVGATENRLQVTISNLGTARENLSAANSRIRDADIAQTSAELTRNNILQQAGVSVLAQANASPQMALSLI